MSIGSLVTALAFVIGAAVLFLAARRRGMASEGMAYVVLAGLAGGVLGAKLTEWVVSQGGLLAANPGAIADPRLGGRTLIGGVIFGWAAVEVAKWRLGIRRSTGDLFALALPAGEAVGRIGCFLNGCCYGVPTHVPWAVYQHGALRHPTQLYSSAVALGTFVLLWVIRDRLPRPGDLFRLYLVLFGVSRFGLEFLREREHLIAALSLAQWTCLELAVVGAVGLALSFRRVSSAPPLVGSGG